MAFTFLGVYFQDEDGTEYRCGFHDDDHYMPLLERRDNNVWVKVNQQQGTSAAGKTCKDIRNQLPITFPAGHTQNERMELINQINLQYEPIHYRTSKLQRSTRLTKKEKRCITRA